MFTGVAGFRAIDLYQYHEDSFVVHLICHKFDHPKRVWIKSTSIKSNYWLVKKDLMSISYKQMKKYQLVFLVGILVMALLFFVKPWEYSSTNKVYTTLSNQESCFNCHQQNDGYSEYHNPAIIGCVSCHLGDSKNVTKEGAHDNMVRIPGNLSDASETCGVCHPNELKKINGSLMTTNSGIVAVDKFIFGEAATPNGQYHITDIKHSASEKHIRDLCSNCHLGAEKTDFGAITQMSRGGGCNACHLNYTQKASEDLNTYLDSDKEKLPTTHPSTDVFMTNMHCYGCHSRSGRISTNYEGWQETIYNDDEIPNDGQKYKVNDDKRVYQYIKEDVHHALGLLCIDCHSSHEVMGDGKNYAHAEDAVKVTCSDCHTKGDRNTVKYEELDAESLLVFMHRKYTHQDKEMIAVADGNHPLVNTYIKNDTTFLIGKKDNKMHALSPQGSCSKDAVHSNLACSTCHSSWATKCIGCHNEYEPNAPGYDLLEKRKTAGQWKEFVAEFSATQPSLGIKETEKGIQIKPAIPGMILTIDHKSFDSLSTKDTSFHRLYAPSAPHTTTKKVRNCTSCHLDPQALGYGSGELVYNTNTSNFTFTPTYANNNNDNLPEDAWIPFLKNDDPDRVKSTRTDFRPFSIKEQQKMLTVGACFSCHDQASIIMKESLTGSFNNYKKNVSEKCVLPFWE